MSTPYIKAKQQRRTIHNPWLQVDIDRIMAENRHEWIHEFILTVQAYVDARAHGRMPFRCSCGGEVHYRPTVVGYTCVSCRKLYYSDRTPVENRLQKAGKGKKS